MDQFSFFQSHGHKNKHSDRNLDFFYFGVGEGGLFKMTLTLHICKILKHKFLIKIQEKNP